jgi:hypothetical protein
LVRDLDAETDDQSASYLFEKMRVSVMFESGRFDREKQLPRQIAMTHDSKLSLSINPVKI